MGAGRARIFRSVRFPTALPFFFAGLRIAITYAVVAAIFAEYAGASEGLGIYMQNAKNSFRTDLVLAAVLVSALLTLALFALTYALERIAIPWYRLSRQAAANGERRSAETRAARPEQALRRARGAARPLARSARRGVRGHPRAERLRQVHGVRDPHGRHARERGRGAASTARPTAYRPAASRTCRRRTHCCPWRRVLDNATLGPGGARACRAARRASACRPLLPTVRARRLRGARIPFQLSGGMRQRAALLRTVVQECEVLLLDEPFGALDALTRAEMQRWLESVWAHFRWTVVLITHDVREAVYLADRVYVLSPRPGTVVAEIAVPLDRPRSLTDPRLAQLETELLALLLGGSQPTEPR